MTNKFTIGSQWTTKGGWRAVVVDESNGCYYAWHDKNSELVAHNNKGENKIPYGTSNDFDLITPYTEPRKGTVWVNVWEDNNTNEIVSIAWDSEKDAKEDTEMTGFNTLLASFKHDWTEGDKI
jgi:hypothetical protein